MRYRRHRAAPTYHELDHIDQKCGFLIRKIVLNGLGLARTLLAPLAISKGSHPLEVAIRNVIQRLRSPSAPALRDRLLETGQAKYATAVRIAGSREYAS